MQVNFVPIEEKERIGKRRMLSGPDESRSASTKRNSAFLTNSIFSSDIQGYPRRSSEPEPPIEIRIHTAEMPLGKFEKPQSARRSNSSESMLLGDNMDDELEGQHVYVHREPSTEPDKPQGDWRSEKWQRGNETRSFSELSMDGSSSMPVLHRFTLDDQILAEKEKTSDLNHATSEDRRKSLQRSQQNHFAGFDDPHEQLSFPMATKINDRFSEDPGSGGSNSDSLPQTQKITRQLPPSQPFSRKQRANSILDQKEFCPEIQYPHSKAPMTFFGQRVPTPGEPDGANIIHYDRSSPIQTFSFASNQIKSLENSPTNISANRPKNLNDEPKESNRSLETAPKFRFPALWTPYHNEQGLVSAEEAIPTNVPTSPFVVAISGHSSPFGKPRKAWYLFNKGFTSVSCQSNEDEKHIMSHLTSAHHFIDRNLI